MGNLRSVQTPSEASENFGSFCSLQNLGIIREPNLDPGGLVPSETFEGSWELSDAFGHYGGKLRKRLNASGSLRNMLILDCWSLLSYFKAFGNFLYPTFGGLWNGGLWNLLLSAEIRCLSLEFWSLRKPLKGFGTLGNLQTL